jgi:hypothetical protein
MKIRTKSHDDTPAITGVKFAIVGLQLALIALTIKRSRGEDK